MLSTHQLHRNLDNEAPAQLRLNRLSLAVWVAQRRSLTPHEERSVQPAAR